MTKQSDQKWFVMDKGFYVICVLIGSIYMGIRGDLKEIKSDTKPIPLMAYEIKINTKKIDALEDSFKDHANEFAANSQT